MFLNNSPHLLNAAFPQPLRALSHSILSPSPWTRRNQGRLDAELSATTQEELLCVCWMMFAGQLEEGNYLLRLSDFPKMSWVFNAKIGTRTKPFNISVYCSSLCSRTTCPGTSCFQGRTGTLPWNSHVHWSWHGFNRASWFSSVFLVICRFQETGRSIITNIIKINLVRVQVILSIGIDSSLFLHFYSFAKWTSHS